MDYKISLFDSLIFIFLCLLIVAGYLSFKSIDFQILKKLEQTPLVLPTPIEASPSAVLKK